MAILVHRRVFRHSFRHDKLQLQDPLLTLLEPKSERTVRESENEGEVGACSK